MDRTYSANRLRIKTLLAGGTAIALTGAVIGACGGNDDPLQVSSGTVIQHATVVNTGDGSMRTDVSIVVDAGKIRTITAGPVAATGTAKVIDASGKYVVPGFLDMHTHLYTSPDNEQLAVEHLLLANGITGIREMRGSPALLKSAQQLNANSAAGLVDAPEVLLMPGEIIGQNAAPAAATSASDAVLTVQQQKAYGVGFIKTVNANRNATLAFLAEARNQGLDVAGHLSPSVSAKESSNAGWKAIEHLGSGMGILLDCAAEEDAVRTTLLSGQGAVPPPNPPTWSANAANAPLYQRVFASYDNAKCHALAQTFAKNGTWHVPTLIRVRTQRFLNDPLYSTDPNLVYVSKATRATWQASGAGFASLPASAIATFNQYFSRELTLPKLMKQDGVQILAGSDTGPLGTWVIPGFSLHQEFALLAESGLSPLEILQSTTLNGAKFLHREATMGTVEEGKNADLVLLAANPLDSVKNLDKISGVFLKGRYFSADALNQMKIEVAKTYAAQTAPTSNTAAVETHAD